MTRACGLRLKLPTFSVITPALWAPAWFQIVAPGRKRRWTCLRQTSGLRNKGKSFQSLAPGFYPQTSVAVLYRMLFNCCHLKYC